MKRNSPLAFVSVLTILLSSGVGCGKKLDDAKMSSQIQSRFSQDSGLSAKQLTVKANNGVVTLSGNVDNIAQRDAAGRQAAAVPGVTTVINNLEVGDASASAPSSQPKEVGSAPPVEKPQPGMEASNKATGKRNSEKSRRAKNSVSRSDRQSASANENQSQPDSTQADSTQPDSNQPASSAPENSANTAPTASEPPRLRQFIIDQGTQITVRLIDPIDSEKNQVGDTFHATLNTPLTSDGEQAVPAGVELTGHLVDVKSASKFAGKSVVVLQLDNLSAAGKNYSLQTDQYRKEGTSRGKNTAEKVGGGAVLGSIIGALAGGGKGAAIGAAAGAGVGGGVQAASKSQQIKLPSETVLNFTLQAPITVIQAPAGSERPKLSDSQ